MGITSNRQFYLATYEPKVVHVQKSMLMPVLRTAVFFQLLDIGGDAVYRVVRHTTVIRAPAKLIFAVFDV
jgi:hypothetical protein